MVRLKKRSTVVRPMGSWAGRDADPDTIQEIAYDYRRKIGAKVRELREAAEMTQLQLGEMLGIGHTGVSAMELGRSTIRPEAYNQIAEIFDLDKQEFGRFLLRYTNPWIYALLYGEREKSLKEDLRQLPSPKGKDQ